jgi:hypothetical protein
MQTHKALVILDGLQLRPLPPPASVRDAMTSETAQGTISVGSKLCYQYKILIAL